MHIGQNLVYILKFAAIKKTEQKNNKRNNNNHEKQENICILLKLPTSSFSSLLVHEPMWAGCNLAGDIKFD